MSEWKKVKLKDICSKIIDCVNKTAPVCDYETPYKMLRTSDIRNGQINTEGLKCVTKETFEKWNRRGYLQKGDVIFTREAPVGEVGWLKDPKNLFLGQRLMFFRTDNNKCDNRFLFYSLSFSDNKRNIIAMSNGSTVNHLRVPDCENIEISIPDLPIQHRIATILSRYDSLIENYQKQIKLLEEAAQRLYKEWFVDLHFPGHENTKIVDGVPEGWEKKPVNTIIELQSGYAFKSTTFEDSGQYKIVTIKNVKDGLFDGDNVSFIKSIPEKMPAHCLLQSGDILLSLTGNVGRVCLVVGKNYLLNQRVAKLSSHYPAFAYCLFRNYDMFIAINNLANGAAQQNVSPIKIGELHILVAGKGIMDRFEQIVGKYRLKIIDLQSQIRLLTEARDRLLPRMMSS